jgi:hypothetical protein
MVAQPHARKGEPGVEVVGFRPPKKSHPIDWETALAGIEAKLPFER